MNDIKLSSDHFAVGTVDPGFRRVEPRDAIPLFRQYLRIVYRWRFIILGSIAFFVLAGLIVTLLLTPKYTATTTLEIARDTSRVVNIQNVEQETSIQDQEFYQTQYGLLKSRALAESVAKSLRLVDSPTFYSAMGVNPDKVLGSADIPAKSREKRLDIAAELLLKRIDIAPTRLSRLVDVSFESPDPKLSVDVVNAWSRNFIESNLERRYQANSYARNFLENRLNQLRGRLEISERQLVGYASNQRIINLPAAGGQGENRGTERSLVADDLAALNADLSQATAERIKAEARYQSAQAATKGAVPEALANTAINQLRERRGELAGDYAKLMQQFTPEYPAAKALSMQISQLDRAIGGEERRVLSSYSTGLREASQREQGLQRKVEELKADLLQLRRRSIQYNIFQRDVDTNRQLYDALLQRYKEIGVSGGIGTNNVSIVDPAVLPEKPSSPRLLLNLAISLALGALIGAVAAYLLEHSNEAFTDPAEVEFALGLPVLGAIPKQDGIAPHDALLDRKSQLVEAYLSVQTNLAFSTSDGVPRRFAVTSSRPAEGKSTTAFALAVTLARGDKAVLLLDADMRSPSLHHLIDSDNEEGLSNLLAGQGEPLAMVRTVPNYGFDALTAGPTPPNAAELLAGDRLSMVISDLLTKYDHVILDSPPVMGLADAPLISSRVDAVVFVVESHGVRASIARVALSRLRSAHARVIGTVLTKFEAKRAHFGYGYDYGYGYGRAEDRETKG
jgi:capsular exopolysaccharide synthesis family protein